MKVLSLPVAVNAERLIAELLGLQLKGSVKSLSSESQIEVVLIAMKSNNVDAGVAPTVAQNEWR